MKENLKNESEISAWLVENGVAESKSLIIIQKLKAQIKRHKKEDLIWTYLKLSCSILGILLFSFSLQDSIKTHRNMPPTNGIVLIASGGIFFRQLRNLYNLHFPKNENAISA